MAAAGIQGCIVRAVKIQLLVKVIIQMMVDVRGGRDGGVGRQ